MFNLLPVASRGCGLYSSRERRAGTGQLRPPRAAARVAARTVLVRPWNPPSLPGRVRETPRRTTAGRRHLTPRPPLLRRVRAAAAARRGGLVNVVGRTLPGPPPRQSLMTLRVYTATRDGVVKDERAPVHVVAGDRFDLYGLSQAWPPLRLPPSSRAVAVAHRPPAKPWWRCVRRCYQVGMEAEALTPWSACSRSGPASV